MERREKILAIVAGGLLALVVGVYLIRGVFDSIANARGAVKSAENKLEDAELKAYEIGIKDDEIINWEEMSLPGDINLAKNRYQTWLNEQAAFRGQVVSAQGQPQPIAGKNDRGEPRVFQLTYTLSGDGTLEDLTNFLYNFYSVKTLHRISSLSVRPAANRGSSEYSNDLTITARIDAIVIPGTTTDRDLTAEDTNYWPLDQFELVVQDAILDRNLFDYNAEPQLFDIRDKRVSADESSISFNVRAEDPEGRPLSYSLQGAPPGMSIDSRGEITFRPRDREEDATYENIVVTVEDIGMKSRQVSKTFAVEVAAAAPTPEPPEETPFDITKYTVITSLGDFGTGPEVWIDNRPEGLVHKLHANETVEIGQVEFTVVSVDLDGESVTIAAADKERVLTLGDNLTGFATPLQTAFQPTTSRRGFGNRGGFGNGGFGNGGPPTTGRGGFGGRGGSRGGDSQRGGRGSGRGRRGGG